MLTSQLGIKLMLLMGESIPLPASYDVMQALSKVVVTNNSDGWDGFELTFTMNKEKPPDYNLLQGDTFKPLTRVTIAVLLGITPEVLINGVIAHHHVTPSSEPGMTTLTVKGMDISVMMALQETNAKYENQPDFLIFETLIAKGYASMGVVPQATPTTDIPIMIDRIPRQHETDLRFVRRMAKRNGFVFYVEPLTIGVSTAYFGPEIRAGLPQSALTMNMGDWSNLNSLDFSQDALAPVSPSGVFVDPIFKLSIPIPSLPSLRIPPLVTSSTPASRKQLLRETANQNPGQALTSLLAAESTTPESITGEGEVDTVRYGHVLKARQLVGVRGMGFSYDGFYYVRRVTHTLARGEYTQSFKITREGTGTLVPFVIP
jgi:hypothetical protein